MATIVTYDVPSKHVDLKQILFKAGYSDHFFHPDNGTPRKVFLPNTTVYHASNSAKQCWTDLVNACSSLNIELERCIASQLGPDWSASWGKHF